MKAQSLDFNIGYAFSKIENKYIGGIVRDNLEEVGGVFWIPKCWFGLKPTRDPEVFLCTEDYITLKGTLCSTLRDLAPSCSLSLGITPDEQYIKFDYIIKKKPKIKKMTVEEIEKALGYKVEIVS